MKRTNREYLHDLQETNDATLKVLMNNVLKDIDLNKEEDKGTKDLLVLNEVINRQRADIDKCSEGN